MSMLLHGQRRAPALAAPDGLPHHWLQGPQNVEPAGRGWRFRWYLDRVDGADRRAATRAIYAVLRDPRSWERSGVRFVRTFDRRRAHVLLRIVRSGQTACGSNAAGCYSEDGASTPSAEIDASYLGDPVAFATVLGMELCGHACFRMLDMYTAAHQPTYNGVMGTWEQARALGGFPSDLEIEAAREWLRGRARWIHDD